MAGPVPLISILIILLVTDYTSHTAFPGSKQRDLPTAAAPERWVVVMGAESQAREHHAICAESETKKKPTKKTNKKTT